MPIENGKACRDTKREDVLRAAELHGEDLQKIIAAKSFSWWRYPVSVFALIAAYFIIPFVAYVALAITNIFIPAFYKNSESWMVILSYIIAAVVGFQLVEKVMKETRYVFQAVLAAVAAAYAFFVAITNRLAEIITFDQFMGFLAFGVTCIAFVGLSCKKNATVK